jgi:hypothetical protein
MARVTEGDQADLFEKAERAFDPERSDRQMIRHTNPARLQCARQRKRFTPVTAAASPACM